MSLVMRDIEDDLSNAIADLRNCFEGFDFLTKDKLSESDLYEIDGFEKFALDNLGQVIEFDDFHQKIYKSLYSLDDDQKKSDFDWDTVQNHYDQISEQYINYKVIKEQVEDNLTGSQELKNIELPNKEELADVLLQFALDNNMVYEITNPEDGTAYYLINAHYQKRLDEM